MDQRKEHTMPTSELYDSIRAALQQHLPTVIESQVESLGLAIVGAVQSMSSQMAKIARAMPLDTSAVAKEQRLRRLLSNERLTQTEHYHPVVQQALHGLAHQRVQLLIDRVLLRNQHNILVVSVAFRRRSIPLVWRALPHRGSSDLSEQQEMLRTAVSLLPAQVRISVHGDSEFRSQALFGWLRSHGYDAMLGVTGRLWIYESDERVEAGQPLEARVTALPPQTARGRKRKHRISPITYLAQIYVLQDVRNGPVNIIAWWERDADEKVVLHAVMTNLPATARTKAYGKRRMWIETVFRDWQSGGFHLDDCGIPDTDRVVRLLLVLALAYLWLVSLGRWLVKRGYRRLIDDGASRSWHFSLFQLGVGWLERLRSFPQPPPVILYLYV
jgi:DDE family transposase